MPFTPLVSPIPGPDAGGIDLTFLPEFDAIHEARRADDPSLDQGEWARDIKTADWPLVSRLCHDALCRQTKDLRIAGWYLEAQVQMDGLRGLALGYGLLAALCGSLWADLHPRDDDNEERLGCLRWVIGQSPRWIRAAEPGVSEEDTVEACRVALAALDGLEEALDVHVPGEGPSLTVVRDVLRDVQAAHAGATKTSGGASTDRGAGVPDRVIPDVNTDKGAELTKAPAGVSPAGSVRQSSGAVTLECRDDALHCLREVAHYFRETEPHSPVAYLADKAARWGNMPLHEWLQRVLGEGDALVRMRDLLDVRTDKDPA